MREEDLARPVILVKDFLTGEVEYEIYVFGEETFVVPVKRGEEGRAPSRKVYSMRRYRGRVDAEDVRRALSELHF